MCGLSIHSNCDCLFTHADPRLQWLTHHAVPDLIGNPALNCTDIMLCMQSRAIVDGLPGDVVALALPLDVQKIADAGLIEGAWRVCCAVLLCCAFILHAGLYAPMLSARAIVIFVVSSNQAIVTSCYFRDAT